MTSGGANLVLGSLAANFCRGRTYRRSERSLAVCFKDDLVQIGLITFPCIPSRGYRSGQATQVWVLSETYRQSLQVPFYNYVLMKCWELSFSSVIKIVFFVLLYVLHACVTAMPGRLLI